MTKLGFISSQNVGETYSKVRMNNDNASANNRKGVLVFPLRLSEFVTNYAYLSQDELAVNFRNNLRIPVYVEISGEIYNSDGEATEVDDSFYLSALSYTTKSYAMSNQTAVDSWDCTVHILPDQDHDGLYIPETRTL